MFISYAQNFEDVILWRALKDVEKGFYIDIGAQDPVLDSVSLAFYQKGWRGIHVEPSPAYADALRSARQDEVTIEAYVGDVQGEVQFYEVEETGLSTANSDSAARYAAAGHRVTSKSVRSMRLAEILDAHRDRDIHWLKIDVEGGELSVLRSWQPSPVRPWVLVVECIDPLSREDVSAAWEPELVALGYQFAHADGLNRFYVSDAHPELAKALEHGPNVFDEFALSGTSSAPFCSVLTSRQAAMSDQLAESSVRAANLQALVSSLRSDLAQANLEHVAREAELGAVASSLRSEAAQADAARNAREADLNAQVAVHVSELARLHRVILEQGHWCETMTCEVEALKNQIHDLHRSTSWRAMGPFRWVSRHGRKFVVLLVRILAALARRAAALLRSRAPRLFNMLIELRILRRFYRAIVKPPEATSSVATTSPRQSAFISTSVNERSRIDFTPPASTQSQIMSAMARWSKGKRLDA